MGCCGLLILFWSDLVVCGFIGINEFCGLEKIDWLTLLAPGKLGGLEDKVCLVGLNLGCFVFVAQVSCN